ncbi:MAG: RedB protein [Deltaproteobacteria bacterium]|nr:RedB protein [Deltaproteobacteria bacterium]
MGRNSIRALAGLWVLMIVAGMIVLTRHVAIAGTDVTTLTRWPARSAIAREPGRSTLLCFVHPRCACTRATIRELERVVSRAPGAAVRVVFRDDPDGDVTSAPTWSMAARMAGARRVLDRGGLEASRLGATTSGLVLLFDPEGALRFRGGVTSGRGHEGNNDGAAALESALRGRPGARAWARVFGCGLAEQ